MGRRVFSSSGGSTGVMISHVTSYSYGSHRCPVIIIFLNFVSIRPLSSNCINYQDVKISVVYYSITLPLTKASFGQ